jgi:hypothetical protein
MPASVVENCPATIGTAIRIGADQARPDVAVVMDLLKAALVDASTQWCYKYRPPRSGTTRLSSPPARHRCGQVATFTPTNSGFVPLRTRCDT